MGLTLKNKTILISGILFLSVITAVPISSAADMHQVSGSVMLGPIAFSPPKGFWYSGPQSDEKDMRFAATFYKTKEDYDLAQEHPSPDRDPIIVVRVTVPNTFKDFNSYYRQESEKDLRSGTEKMHYSKELPSDIQKLFRQTPRWSCKEDVSKGFPELIVVDCVSLDHYFISITKVSHLKRYHKIALMP